MAVSTAACVDSGKLDDRVTVSIEDVVRTKAEVDVTVGAVDVGVIEDMVVCSSRKEMSGLVGVSRESMSKPCLLHFSETEERKAKEVSY
jgi:hypothetical protein